jgi:hypothetical protein
MTIMVLKRSERLGINVMFFVFFSVWWIMVRGYKRHWKFQVEDPGCFVFELLMFLCIDLVCRLCCLV